MISGADLHMAEKTMKLKNCNYCMSFVSTIWKGEVIMCCYNNISDEMMNVFCTQDLNPDDVEDLESLIKRKYFT